jgi:regulator of replication initiation timing
MDPTLAAILSELFRLSVENDALKRRVAELEAAAPPPEKKEGE